MLLALVLLAGALAPAPARAQRVRAWTPQATDSLTAWAAEARELFRAQTTDSVHASNFRPYELVGNIGRRLLRSLGRENMAQAHALQAVLDSMGLETRVRVDPVMPQFATVTVRNPYRMTAFANTFVYWYRGNDLRMQGVVILHGQDPTVRVWWSNRPERPYTLGLIDRARDGRLSWIVLGMRREGYVWDIVQFVDRAGADGTGQAAFADMNGDGSPELAVWSRARLDSTFTLCSDCPAPLDEAVFAERGDGFQLHDSRLMPSPVATLSLFARLLAAGNRASAARLLADPAKVDEALRLGWGAVRGRGAWEIEYAEPGEAWPRWLAVRVHDSRRVRYIIRFTPKEGRWLISDWTPVRPARAGADSTGAAPRR